MPGPAVARRSAPPATCWTRRGRRSWSASAATSPPRRTWRRRRRRVPIVVHDANVPAGPGQPDRRAVHPARVHRPPRHQAGRTPRASASRSASEIAGLDRLGSWRQGARAFRAPARPAGAAGHRRLAGRQVAEPGGARRGRRDPRRGGPGAAHRRPAQRPRVHVPPAGPPYITLPYVDRMDLAYAAADFALCRSRGDDLRRAHRGGPARGVRAAAARQRRAAAERAAHRAGGGGLIVADAELSPRWICEVLLPVMLDPELVAGDVRGGRAAGQPGTPTAGWRRRCWHHRGPAAGPRPRGRAGR